MRRNRSYSNLSTTAKHNNKILCDTTLHFLAFLLFMQILQIGTSTVGWKYTLTTFNAIILLNKYSEIHLLCNRSLSNESLHTHPLQGSCCGQAKSRNADWYPKGSGLRISLSASLFFLLHPKQSRALEWC